MAQYNSHKQHILENKYLYFQLAVVILIMLSLVIYFLVKIFML